MRNRFVMPVMAAMLLVLAMIGVSLVQRPAAPPFETSSFDYENGSVVFMAGGEKATARIRGHVVAPVGANDSRPVVLFLHGYYDYCQTPEGEAVFEWPCPSGHLVVESYKGFEQAQQALAREGFVTVSIDSNDVTARDDSLSDKGVAGRSAIVRGTLDALSRGIGHGLPRLDLRRVMLVGHSRGGMGVAQAALDSPADAPWTIAGLAYVAPTNTLRLVNPTIPSVAFLPPCDGDVTALEGQIYVDGAARYGEGAALHSSIIVPGGVHNFFNTEWTPEQSKTHGSDDGDRAGCKPLNRLSAAQQQQILADYLVISAKAFLENDAASASLLRGEKPATRTTNPVAIIPAGGPADILFNAIGAHDQHELAATPTGNAAWCTGAECRSGLEAAASPHWLTGDSRDGYALAVPLGNGSAGGVRFAPTPLAAGDEIAMRVITLSDSDAQFRAELLDGAGKVLAGGQFVVPRLGVHPGTEQGTGTRDLAQLVRLPLDEGTLRGTAVELRITGDARGRLAILDTVVRREGKIRADASPATIAAPSRAIEVVEGDAPHVHSLTLPIKGTISRPASVAFVVEGAEPEAGNDVTWVDVKPGDREVHIPVTIPGNTVDDDDVRPVHFLLESRGPLVVSNAEGRIAIRDDDADPVLDIKAVRDSVAPGGTLEWALSLSAPSNRSIVMLSAEARPVGGELLAADLAPESRSEWGISETSGTLSGNGASITCEVSFDEPCLLKLVTTPSTRPGSVRLEINASDLGAATVAISGRVR